VGVDRREEERPGGEQDEADRGRRDGEQYRHLPARDPEEGSEEERVEAAEDPVVEADEEEAEGEGERLQRPDRGRLCAQAAPRSGDPREKERAEPAESEVADRQR